MRFQWIGPSVFTALLLWLCSLACAQFVPPSQTKSTDLSGTVEAVYPQAIVARDKNMMWKMNVDDRTTVRVTGKADRSYLRPGVLVRVTGTIDSKGAVKEPISEIELIQAEGKNALGLFGTAAGEDAKPLRNPPPGRYDVRGRVASFKDDEILIVAGGKRITGKVSQSPEVKVNLDDLSNVQVGDEVKVKYYPQRMPNAFTNMPGEAFAEELTVTMSKPLESGKKPKTAKSARHKSAKPNDAAADAPATQAPAAAPY